MTRRTGKMKKVHAEARRRGEKTKRNQNYGNDQTFAENNEFFRVARRREKGESVFALFALLCGK
jgi:hypothetical protein